MAKDFRASQIETSKLIASGGISGTKIGLAIYSGSIQSNRAGGISDSAIFNNVGTDVFLFVSGTTSNSDFDRTNVSLFGGDVVISGTLYAERQVIEVDSVADGDFFVTGNFYQEPDTNSTTSVAFRKADGTDLLNVDSTKSSFSIGEGTTIGSMAQRSISAGYKNLASSPYSLALGGYENTGSAANATAIAGRYNRANGTFSTVLGGDTNLAGGASSAVIASDGSTATGAPGKIFGGGNTLAAHDRTILIGRHLTSSAVDQVILGTGETSPQFGSSYLIVTGAYFKSNVSTAAIFNEDGNDVDFRVESVDETHMIFVEGSSNRVSIGDSVDSPAATLEVTNNASAGAFNVPLVQLNSNDVDKIAVDINAANTTANVIDVAASALTTGNALYIDHNDSATTAVTPKSIHLDFDKSGVAGDGITQEFKGLHIDLADAATNHANSTVFMVGLEIEVDSASTQGANTNIGLSIVATDATINDGINIVAEDDAGADIKMMSSADSADYATITVAGNGVTNIKTVENGVGSNAHLTLEVDGDITLKPAANNVYLNDGSNNVFDLDVSDPTLKIMDDAQVANYFSINVGDNGATTITTVDADAAAANLTFTIDGTTDLNSTGAVTIDTTSADGHIAITSAHTAGDAILISANADAGSILDIDAGIMDVDVQGIITIDGSSTLSLDVTGDTNLTTSGGVLTLQSGKTGASALILSSSHAAGGIKIEAGTGDLLIGSDDKVDIDATGIISIDTTNTATGITIATATVGVPISIGNATSETTVNDNLNVTGDLFVSQRIKHTGDTDTYIDFGTDVIEIFAANKNFANFTDTASGIFLNPDSRNDINVVIATDNKIAFVTDSTNDRVLIHSGGAATSYDESKGLDINFYVSGSVGSKGTAIKGTSVFGGDAHLSGAFSFSELASAPSVGTNEAALYALDDSGTTKIYYKDSTGTQVGPLGAGGSLDDSYDTPAGGGAKSTGIGAIITVDGQAVQLSGSNGINAATLAVTGSTVMTSGATTTGTLLDISGTAFTTGTALAIDDNSANTGTRNTVEIIQNNAAALAATAVKVQSDGGITGINLDKNYSDTTAATVSGLIIDMDKTGNSTSNNAIYGINIDLDNTTATNGVNEMFGIKVTPTLTHAADAGTALVFGYSAEVTGGTNGAADAIGFDAVVAGADTNIGLNLNVADGGTDIKLVSSADIGDYFSISTTTHGATTLATVDDDLNNDADLTLDADGKIIIEAKAGDEVVLNELGVDVDFRVETNNKTHALFADGGNDAVLIGESSLPGVDTNFFVSGSIGSSGTTIKGTSVFGGDVIVSGSLLSKKYTDIKIIHTNLSNASAVMFIPIAGSQTMKTTSIDDKSNMLMSFSGSLKKIMMDVQSTCTLGISFHKAQNATAIGHFTSSFGNNEIIEFNILSGKAAGIGESALALEYSGSYDFNPGDQISIGCQKKSGSTPGRSNINLIFEYDLISPTLTDN